MNTSILELFTIVIANKGNNWNVFLIMMEVSLKQTHKFLGHFKVKKNKEDPICLPGLF